MNQYTDIIIFAVIAFILFLRLFWILGQKKGKASEDVTIIKIKDVNYTKSPLTNFEVEVNGSTSLEAKIKIFDPSFSRESFTKYAEAQFKKILAAYSRGDNHELSTMINIDTLRKFAYSMSTIEDNKCTHNLQVIKSDNPQIENIDIIGNMAEIKVKFTAEIVHSIANPKGKILAGHDSKVEHLNQIWTFSRELKFEESPWIVINMPDDLIYIIK